GITVLILGNSLMDTAARGIGKTYVESYTGHIVITAQHHGNLTIMGMEGPDAIDTPVRTTPEFQRVLEHVASHPEVRSVNAQATATAIVDYGDKRGFTQLFGIDPEQYTAMFPDNVEILKGRMLAPGEEGIVLSEEIATQLQGDDGAAVVPGESLLLTGMSQS